MTRGALSVVSSLTRTDTLSCVLGAVTCLLEKLVLQDWSQLLEDQVCTMAAFSESGPVFKTRCAQVGLAPEDVEKLEKVGVNSLAKVAFMTSYTPGSGDDKDLISAFEAALGTPPNVGQKSSFRRLFHEAYAVTTSEMRMLVERTDESVPRKLSVPERSERFEVVSKRLVGLEVPSALIKFLWASSASLSCEAPGSLLLGTTSMSEGDGIASASGVDSDETQAPSTSSWLTAFPAAAENLREVGDGAPGPQPSMMDIGDLYVEVGRVKSSLGEECAALAFSLQRLRDELNDFKSVVTAFMAEVRGEIEELQVGFTRAAASANSRRPVLPAGARNRSRSA